MTTTDQAKTLCAEACLDGALADSKGELTGCVRRIRADVGRLADPAIMARYHPWLLIGSGMAIGMLGATGLARATASRPSASTAVAATPPRAPVPAATSFVDRIAPLVKLLLPLLV